MLDESKSQEQRLLQSESVVEVLHRLLEQSEHYRNPRMDRNKTYLTIRLFALVQHLEYSAKIHGLISSAFGLAMRHLPEGIVS